MVRNAHKKKKEDNPPSWGEVIGGTLAFAQDTVDSVVGWGFEKLRETANKPPRETPRHPAAEAAEKAARSAAGFIGDVGASFYATYDALKEEKRKKARIRKSKK